MKFVAEFIEIFIEPFTFIIGPIAVMVLIAATWNKWHSDKTKKAAAKAEEAEMPPPRITDHGSSH